MKKLFYSLGILVAMNACNKSDKSGTTDITDTGEAVPVTSITSIAPSGTLNVGDSFQYQVQYSKFLEGQSYSCRIENAPASMTIDADTCEVTWQQAVAGSYSPTIIVENNTDSSDKFVQEFNLEVDGNSTGTTGINGGGTTSNSGGIVISSTPPSSWTQGDYSYSLAHSESGNSNYVCSLEQVDGSSSTPGLEFNSSDCSVRSTQVMAAGTYKFRLVVTNQAQAGGSATQEIWLQVPAQGSVTITSTPPTSLSQSNQYVYNVTYQSTLAGATYVCSISDLSGYTLPPQIVVDPQSCVVSVGSALTAGSYGYVVNVTNSQDSSDQAQQQNTINLGSATSSAINITSQPPTSWESGNYSYQLTYTGQQGSQYVCRVDQVSGFALPPGLQLNEQTCTVASTSAMSSGTYKYRFVVQNTSDAQDSTYQELSIVVPERVIITSQPPQVTSVANYVYAVQYSPANVNATYTCSLSPISGKTYPPSIIIGSSSCVVSIPQNLTQGEFGFDVVVTNTQDSNDFQTQKNYINVN